MTDIQTDRPVVHWHLRHFFEQAGQAVFGASWDGHELDLTDDNPAESVRLSRLERANVIESQIGSAFDAGLIRFEVDLARIDPGGFVQPSAEKFDFATDGGQQGFRVFIAKLLIGALASQKLQYLQTTPSGLVHCYPVLLRWDRRFEIDWEDSLVTLHKSCIVSAYRGSAPLFSDEENKFQYEVNDVLVAGSLSELLPDELTLNGYIVDPSSALKFFRPVKEKGKQGESERKKRHDWPRLVAAMWRYLAVHRPDPILRGLQTRLIKSATAQFEDKDDEPPNSQLADYASYVIRQYSAGEADAPVLPQRFTTLRDRVP